MPLNSVCHSPVATRSTLPQPAHSYGPSGRLYSTHGTVSFAQAPSQKTDSLSSAVKRKPLQSMDVVINGGLAKYRQIVQFHRPTAVRGGYSQAPITLSLEQMLEVAPRAKAELDQLAHRIARPHMGVVVEAPIKSAARAKEKIDADYGGDPSGLKDLARNTIVVEARSVGSVAESLRQCGAKVKVIDGQSDPLGYSGVNSSVTTSFRIMGEIQVNTPAMIYAKEGETTTRQYLGMAAYNKVASRTSVLPGLGHKYYEEWRILPPDDPKGQAIAKQSRSYYDTVRSENGY